MWWTFTLMAPGATFASAPGYLGMALLSGRVLEWLWLDRWLSAEVPWALLFGWLGITQIGSLVLEHERPLRWATFWGAGLWGFLAGTFCWSNPHGTGVGTYAIFAFACLWAWWRIGMVQRGQL